MNRGNGFLMVLDAGGGGGRCLLFTSSGEVAASAYLPWSFTVPDDAPFGSEFNPDELWYLLGEVARAVLCQGGISPSSVRGIAATSFRDGVVFLDEEGTEIYGGSNMDARGITYAADMAEKIGDKVKEITGRHPLGLDVAAKLLWFRDNRPGDYARIHKILMVSDWITYRLTGAYTSESSNACSSMLFDIRSSKWSPEIAAALELPSIFPPCLEGGARAGRLFADASAHLGLPEGIPVGVGMGDSQAGLLGCGCTGHGQVAAILGTTMPVLMVLENPVEDSSGRTWLGRHSVKDRWVLESNGGVAGAVLQWFCDTFGPSGCTDPFVVLEEAASGEEPGPAFAFLGPRVADMSRLQFPLYGGILFSALGFTPSLTPSRLARSILENVAYAVRGNIEQLERLGGLKVEQLCACGGMARSKLMIEILAAVCGVPVVVPRIREASSLGTAMSAATAAGIYATLEDAASSMVSHEEPVYNDSLKRQYAALYREWVELGEKLSG